MNPVVSLWLGCVRLFFGFCTSQGRQVLALLPVLCASAADDALDALLRMLQVQPSAASARGLMAKVGTTACAIALSACVLVVVLRRALTHARSV